MMLTVKEKIFHGAKALTVAGGVIGVIFFTLLGFSHITLSEQTKGNVWVSVCHKLKTDTEIQPGVYYTLNKMVEGSNYRSAYMLDMIADRVIEDYEKQHFCRLFEESST